MRAFGTRAAGIAHDLNIFHSIIKGSAQIIDGNINDKEKIRTRVSRIQMVVEQGTGIVKALLGLGRVNDQELAACDLHELLQQTLRLVADRFPESLRIEIETEPGLPRIRCSAEVLQQMLINFILNAADAMNNQGLVQLSARRVKELPNDLALEPEPAPAWIAVSVADQGGGINEDVLPRIFEPFFTTKSFSSRRGTGLGLSMAYELAKGLGYGLQVDTSTGSGTTFSVLIPFKINSQA
jgi:signal transduction histidine kinase